MVVVITGKPHDIASRNTSPKGSLTEGATKTLAHDSPSGSSSCRASRRRRCHPQPALSRPCTGVRPPIPLASRPRSRAVPGS